MNKIKKTTFCILISIFLLLTSILANTASDMFASAESNAAADSAVAIGAKNVESNPSDGISIPTIFDNQSVSTCEYIYNLDDSADYIYVEFEKGGYAVFAKQTMEMMEYSLQGSLPYGTTDSKKYYAGPANYLEKSSGQFVDASTGAQLEISESEAINYAQNVRQSLITDKVTEVESSDYANLYSELFKQLNDNNSEFPKEINSSAPGFDSDNLIHVVREGTFIPNYDYFDAYPEHGDNDEGGIYGDGNSGTCGPVAAQLLLSYNNFYNDRRIIPDRFLNGYDDATNTVSDKERNPNYCSDPMNLNNWTTGTRSEATGENSFYYKMITSIMEPNASSASIKAISGGIDAYLKEYISTGEYSVNYEVQGWSFGYKPISSSKIKSEIDAGRPLIICTSSNLCGISHAVVGYGYQDYTYPDGGGTYSGYVVHTGWTYENCVWINSSWCNAYISLKMTHGHNYYTKGAIGTTGRYEYKCTVCGHRTDAAIYMSSSERYVERIANITLDSSKIYQDYYVRFETGGNKLFQTFGPKDAILCLYDLEYNLLAYDDNSGYNLNSFFSYNVKAFTRYILRVQFSNKYALGSIKIGITPASVAYSSYENILHLNSNSNGYAFSYVSYTTCVICYTPGESGTYKFTTYSYDGIDTCLYLIDPSSTNTCLFNDDDAGDSQALIQTDLIANRRYFLIVSPYYIDNYLEDEIYEGGSVGLQISKIS